MSEIPPLLERLLAKEGDVAGAWAAFVAEYSRLLLHVARSVNPKHDDAMDAYVFVLERLREDDFRRLREFTRDPRSKMTTWLVVVARRLSIDHYRSRYGRARGEATSDFDRGVRRRLRDLTVYSLEAEIVATDDRSPDADTAIREYELQSALQEAVSALDAGDQLLLRLRFRDDLPAQEIARIMRFTSQFQVYRRINSLLAELRRTLQRRGIESGVS